MGHYCYSDVVDYVKYGVFDGECDDGATAEMCMLTNPNAFNACECNCQFDANGKPIILRMSARGWDCLGSHKIGKRNQLYGQKWIDDKGNTVWLVNESESSHVGYFQISIVAKDKNAIKAFAKTFSDLFTRNPNIKGQFESVQYWC